MECLTATIYAENLFPRIPSPPGCAAVRCGAVGCSVCRGARGVAGSMTRRHLMAKDARCALPRSLVNAPDTLRGLGQAGGVV